MTRYLLQQWTIPTIEEERRLGGHGQKLPRAASNFDRFNDLRPGDVVYPAAVRDGRILPISRVVVGRVTTLDELISAGEDPWPSQWQVIARQPLPRTNYEELATNELGRAIRREDGQTLARRGNGISSQAFRHPLWITAASAALLDDFLERVWKQETEEGLEDPERLLQGQGPRLSHADRKAIEDHAMASAREYYERQGWSVDDTSRGHPYDLEIVRAGARRRVEVKGTVGPGASVLITRGEFQNAQFFPTELYILHGVRLHTEGNVPRASGGTKCIVTDWRPTEDNSEPTVYRHFPRCDST